MKRKLIALLLVLSTLFLATACGEEEYPVIESTKEEKETVLTMTYGKEKYEIPYELYRAFFLQLKGSVDGGDASVWSGEQKDGYVEKINGLIFSRIAEIYAVIHLCKEAGIDPYSKENDEKVKEYIKASIEGGDIGGVRFEGFDGDWEAYRASLKEMYMNDSVADLFIRYTLALEELNLYYGGNPDSNDPAKTTGKLTFTKDEVLAFYNGDGAVRVLRAFLPAEAFSEQRANEIRNNIASKQNETAVANYMIQYTLSGGQDVKDGEVIGLYSLDARYYGELTEKAFSLSVGQTSDIISLNSETEVGYTVIYKVEKSAEHFDACYDKIKEVYIQNEIGKLLNSAETALIDGATFTSAGKALDHALIAMP